MRIGAPIVKFSGVTKRFASASGGDADVSALEGVTFTLSPESFLFLTGPSGAGKTTLVRLLYADLLPSRGEVTVCGRSTSRLRAAELPLLRRKLGVIHQGFHLIERKTARDNVALALEVAGTARREALKRADEALELVRLGARKGSVTGTLADGEKQRVALARALVVRPDLVIADEPTGNLDPALSDEVFRILEGVSQRGCAVIVATHDLRRVEASSRPVIFLSGGRIAASRGDVEAVIR